jgi:hypothetical protein
MMCFGYTNLMCILRNTLLVLICIWLPLRGFSAVAMPLCEHGRAGTNSQKQTMHNPVSGQAHHVQVHQHRGHHDQVPGSRDARHHVSKYACDGCGFCALYCASTMPVFVRAGNANGARAALTSTESFLTGIVPPPLSKPPLVV